MTSLFVDPSGGESGIGAGAICRWIARLPRRSRTAEAKPAMSSTPLTSEDSVGGRENYGNYAISVQNRNNMSARIGEVSRQSGTYFGGGAQGNQRIARFDGRREGAGRGNRYLEAILDWKIVSEHA